MFAIAAHIQPRYRLLVLLVAFAQLRYGEPMALRRMDITLESGVPVLRMQRAVTQLNSGERKLKGPKSEAGRRTVALPRAILPELRRHLDTKGFADPGDDGRLFREPKGATPTRQNFNRVWKTA